jgi:hypothetical protein
VVHQHNSAAVCIRARALPLVIDAVQNIRVSENSTMLHSAHCITTGEMKCVEVLIMSFTNIPKTHLGGHITLNQVGGACMHVVHDISLDALQGLIYKYRGGSRCDTTFNHLLRSTACPAAHGAKEFGLGSQAVLCQAVHWQHSKPHANAQLGTHWGLVPGTLAVGTAAASCIAAASAVCSSNTPPRQSVQQEALRA